jgi:hypothetical protein
VAFVDLDTFTATIGSGDTQSNQINLGNKTLVGFSIGLEWTSANLQLEMSPDGGTTWLDLLLYTSEIAASTFVTVDPFSSGWFGVNCIRGTASATQTDGATITFLARGFN